MKKLLLGTLIIAALLIAKIHYEKPNNDSTESLTDEELDFNFEDLTDEQRKRILNVGMEGVPSAGALWLIAAALFILWLFVK